MSSSSRKSSSNRPTLPPIRDLFGSELNRLRVTDEDDVPSHYPSAHPRHSNDYSQRPFNDHLTRSLPPLQSPSGGYSRSSTPSLQYTSYGREGYQSSPRPSHSEYASTSVNNPDHRYPTSRAPPIPNYRYPSVGVEPPYNHSSPNATLATRYPSHHDNRSYSNRDYSSHPRVSTSMDPRNRVEEEEQTPTSWGRRESPPNEIRPTNVVTPAKYECSYCGKGFNRPSSLKIHLNSHTGEKPFTCPVEGCGRSFSVLSNMRRHARVHNPSQISDDDNVSLSQAGPSHLEVTPVNWHQHRRRSSASAESFSSSSDSGRRSDDEDEDYHDRGYVEKRSRHHRH